MLLHRGRAALFFLALGCGSRSSDDVDRRKCEQLRDHLVELRLGVVKDSHINVEAHRTALKQALGDKFISSCQRDVTSTELKCQLAARDTQVAAGCSTAH